MTDDEIKNEVYRLIWDAEAAERAIKSMAESHGVRLHGHYAFVLGEDRMVVGISMVGDTVSRCFLLWLKRWCQSFLDGESFSVRSTGGLVIVNVMSPAPPADAATAIYGKLKCRAKATADGEIRERLKRALTPEMPSGR